MASKHIPCTLLCSLTLCAAHSTHLRRSTYFFHYLHRVLGAVGRARGPPPAASEQPVGLQDWNCGAGTQLNLCPSSSSFTLLPLTSSTAAGVLSSPLQFVSKLLTLIWLFFRRVLEMKQLQGEKTNSKKINISKNVTKKKCDFKLHCNSRWCR